MNAILIEQLRRPLVVIGVLSLIINLLLLAPALFMLQVFDRVLASRSDDTLLVLVVGAGIALALMLALDHLRTRLQSVAGVLAAQSLLPVVTRIALARGAQLDQTGVDRLRDVSTVRALLSSPAVLALFDAPWIVVYLLVIWLAHPALGAAASVATALTLGLAVVNDRLTRRSTEALLRASTGASRFLETSLAQAEVAQALGMGDALLQGWHARNAQALALQRPIAAASAFMAAITRALRQAVQVGLLALGAWLVIRGQASAGVMIATTTLLGRALAPVEQIVGSWRVLVEGRAALVRLHETLGAAVTEPTRMALPAPTGALAAHGLIYRVPGTQQVALANVSLQLDPGQALAVIGASAAGKSTLLRLLCGIWQPSAGLVRLDSADITQLPREQLGPHIGYVPQDVQLFPGTVAENIARMGAVDSQAVVLAAQRAHVHELILSLAQGYDTPIEPGSALLSPGQRQRIALARALYGQPALVLLDEPNANLDGVGEVALSTALRELRGHVTVVVVTHRNTLIQQMDKLLVLEAGRVKHYGAAADVLAAMQSRGDTPQRPAPTLAGAA